MLMIGSSGRVLRTRYRILSYIKEGEFLVQLRDTTSHEGVCFMEFSLLDSLSILRQVGVAEFFPDLPDFHDAIRDTVTP
jgi:hypothetical protein